VLQLGNIRVLKPKAVESAKLFVFGGVTFTHILTQGSPGFRILPQFSKEFRCPFLIATHSFLALSWCLEGTGKAEKVNPISFQSESLFSLLNVQYVFQATQKHCGGAYFLCRVVLPQQTIPSAGS